MLKPLRAQSALDSEIVHRVEDCSAHAPRCNSFQGKLP
jgi:hypothetical protein